MTWLQLATSEWRRKPLRSALTASGIAIAVAGFCSLLAFSRGYKTGVRLELNRLGAHILLVPKGCPYDAASMALHGANWPCYLEQEYLTEARSVPGVATAAPVFMAAVYDSNSSHVVYLGVDTNILALKPAWHVQGSFPAAEGALLIGSEVQKHTGWQLGARVSPPGLHAQFGTVTGILAPTQGAEDSFIYLRLPDAQRLFHHTNELTHILVRLSDPDQMDNVVAQLRGCNAGLAMNVVPLAHLFRTIQKVVDSTRFLLGVIALIALLIAGTGVTNTILMAVSERTREIGVMRALGASRTDIFRLVWLETLQLCLLGSLCGLGGAALFGPAVETWTRSRLPFVPSDPLVHWDFGVAAAGVVLALMLGSLAALLPASRAARLMPVVAMRTKESCS